MWTRTFTKTYQGLGKDAVWAAWSDIATWNAWHHDVEKMKIDGPFVPDATMTMYLREGSNLRTVLTEVTPGKSFTDVTKFSGAQITDYYLLEDTSHGLIATNTITITGPVSFLWVKLVAKDVAETGIKHMDQLEEYLKNNHPQNDQLPI